MKCPNCRKEMKEKHKIVYIKRYYDEDYIELYGCPQCIGMCDLEKGE